MRRRIGIDGWPVNIEAELIEALLRIPGASESTRPKLEMFASFLIQAAELGEHAELPRFRPASQIAADKELDQFRELCEKLVEHIEAMRRPAFAALEAEGLNLSSMALNLHRAAETALYAGGPIAAEGHVRGRPRKQRAAKVEEVAALAFEELAGRHPTYTTDPHTSRRSGDWPEFLGRVLAVLDVEASVDSQVRARSAKNTPK